MIGASNKYLLKTTCEQKWGTRTKLKRKRLVVRANGKNEEEIAQHRGWDFVKCLKRCCCWYNI